MADAGAGGGDAGAGGGAGGGAGSGGGGGAAPRARPSSGRSRPSSARPKGAAARAALSPEELTEFREIFNLVDKDGGGTISKEELAELMETLGINASQEEIDLMIHEVDENNDGDIDFDEFVAVMSRKVNASYTHEQVKSAFKIFEGTAPSGHIKVSDLLNALTTYGSTKLTEEQAAELVGQLEPDSNGLVNYVEYVSMMMAD